MVSHRPEAVAVRAGYPPYRACRNSSCWCWSPLQLDMRHAVTGAASHANNGNPPTVTLPTPRALTAGKATP